LAVTRTLGVVPNGLKVALCEVPFIAFVVRNRERWVRALTGSADLTGTGSLEPASPAFRPQHGGAREASREEMVV
jgi:hypothetical protein